jgi:SulP family sulfate permease
MELPPGIAAFQVHGPLFFGVCAQFIDALNLISPPPKVFILRMGLVPMIDSSGAVALEEFVHRCLRQGTQVILSGLRPALTKTLQDMNVLPRMKNVAFAENFAAALPEAKRLLAGEGGTALRSREQ